MRYIVILLLSMAFFIPNAGAFYDNPYIEYDDDGIKQINCVRCNVMLMERVLVPRQKDGVGEVYVYIFKRLSHAEQISLTLSDGSYTDLWFCRDCKREYQCTEEELAGMTAQFRQGFELEARAVKKSDDYVDHVNNRYGEITVKKRYVRKERGTKR